MRKMLFLAVVPFMLAACTTCRCPNPERCATCPYCNPQSARLTAPAGSTGTAAAPSAPTAFPASTIKVYRIAPAKLVQAIQQTITAAPLNLKIVSADNGVILTDWKAYEGEFHIARHWQDRTRFRISVIPDVNDPANASRFDVAEETQRRSNDLANWEAADRRPDRIDALVQAIDAKLRSAMIAMHGQKYNPRMRTIVGLLVLVLTSVLHAADGAQSAHIVLLHINDPHGHTQPWLDNGKSVGGYARVKTVVDAIRQQEGADHVILLHAGDEISRGDAMTSATLGEANIAILNQIGFTAWTPGNGEFYPGAANLQKLISQANFPTLTGNIRYRLDGKPFADETTVLTVQGVRLGLLGLCFIHEEYPSSWVLKMEPPADAARRLIPELRKKADLIIALDHIGIDADRELAASVAGIDLIVGGHSHTVLPQGERVTDPTGREVLIVQAGAYLHYVGRVDLELQRKGDTWILQKSTARLIPLDATVPEDPAIKATIARLWPATRPTTPAEDAPAIGATALPAK